MGKESDIVCVLVRLTKKTNALLNQYLLSEHGRLYGAKSGAIEKAIRDYLRKEGVFIPPDDEDGFISTKKLND